MSSEPPSKKARRELSGSSSSQPSTAQAEDTQPSISTTTIPYQGNCRAYGGSDHLTLDLESHGFQLLDEANNDDGKEGQYSDSDNDSSLSSDRVSQEEIHALLEEGVTASLGSNKQQLDQQAVAKESGEGEATTGNPKVVQKFLVADLENLFNHFERLPEGWAQITHNSGLPVYLHRPTRVCTFGRPYFMGDGSVRKHDVPLSAIPCLHYQQIKGKLEIPNASELGIENQTAENGTAAEGQATEQPTADLTLYKPAAGALASTAGAGTPQQAESNEGVALPSCPFSGTAQISPLKLEQSGRENDGTRHPNESSVGAITDVPYKDKLNSNSALITKDHLEDRNQKCIMTNTDANFTGAATNESCEIRGAVNDLNGSRAVDSKDCSSNNGPPKYSSTFNTALATALNICPSQPPPKGAPPGSEEVQLEPLKLQTINPDSLRQYCTSRFKFQTVQKMRFKSWSERRIYTKEQRLKNRPPMPEGTKLLSLKTRTYSVDDPRSHKKRNWVLNPKGKSYVCILHEYVQHVLKGQPAYVFKEVQNASSPYAAAIFVNGFEYATGYGSSKRQAKCEAARSTLEILMPELVREIEENEGKKNKESDLVFFDSLRIEDPNVNELCSKMSELPPYSLLLNCIQRNYCLKSDSVESRLISNNKQKNQFIMTVGKHTVQVPCKNKKEGKQKASQALLQKMHPHITSWGSMVRLYGNRSLELLKDKKKVEQEVTLLQNNATVNQPNYSILNMLKAEMLKLHQNKESVQPMGEFRPPEDIRLPTPSSSDLNTLDL